MIIVSKYYLENDRIFLREVRISDVNEKYYSWLNDPEVNRFLETRFIPQSIESIKTYVMEKNSSLNETFFAICLKDDNKHIGNIKLGPINWIHRKADISLFIGEKDLWGQSYASEAISIVVKYAFNELGLNKVKAGAYAVNKASIKAFENCGFKQEGFFIGDVFFDGQEMDSVILGLRVADYRESSVEK